MKPSLNADRRRFSRFAAASLAGVAFTLGGCATVYRSPGGEKADVSQLAVLHNDPKFVKVVAINGESPGLGNWERFELVPGRYEVEVKPDTRSMGTIRGGSVQLVLQAEPGHVYRLFSEVIQRPRSEGLGWHA